MSPERRFPQLKRSRNVAHGLHVNSGSHQSRINTTIAKPQRETKE